MRRLQRAEKILASMEDNEEEKKIEQPAVTENYKTTSQKSESCFTEVNERKKENRRKR